MGRRKLSVTIKHVAADAEVSLQTVSRVINNEPNVRPEMKERVQASIAKLGYVPSIAARRMSGSRSYLILALNDRQRTIEDWRAREGTDWIDQMLLGGMLKCAEYGYRMIFELVDTHNDHVQRELSAAIASLQPDGVILTPPHSDNPLICDLLEKQRIPFARIGSKNTNSGIAISMDDEGSAALATRHLIELGHRRIGFIAGSALYPLSGYRTEGWRGAMAQAELGCNDLFVEGDFGYASGAAAAAQLLDREDRPSAIIASSGQMALACLDAARERGLFVPEQLSIVSFDNSPLVRFTQPNLTAVDQAIAPAFSRAVEWIIAVQRGEAPPNEPEHLPAELIIRGSTAPFVAGPRAP
jgi:LacI family transcriptional regulator